MDKYIESDGDITTITRADDEGNVTVERVQDVESVLEFARAARNELDPYSPSGDMRRLAEIPPIIYEQWLKEGIDLFNPDHHQAVRRKLAEQKMWRSSEPVRDPHIIVKGKR